jgi:hypothetical protein
MISWSTRCSDSRTSRSEGGGAPACAVCGVDWSSPEMPEKRLRHQTNVCAIAVQGIATLHDSASTLTGRQF